LKALILAGGFGTRLRPLTYTRPKHLLPIANRPHIEHVLDLLVACGVDEVVMLTSYLADAFADAIAEGTRRGIRMEVAREEEPLGTAGALGNAADFVSDGTFLALNGDILTDAALGSIIEFHRARSAEATIMLVPVEDPSAFGVVPTEAGGRVTGFIEKPPRDEAPTDQINAGVYVMEPAVFGRIPAGEVYSAERQLFPEIAADGALYALTSDSYWIDVGTPKKYLQANMDALAGTFHTPAVANPGAGTVLEAEDCTVSDSATLEDVCLGAGAVVEAGVTVAGSVLLPGAVVGAGALVEATILGERAKVAPGATIKDAVVADGETCG
jgi:mannose-1-phosphate guanylyltransferase